jgi:hypothetical protein
LNGRSRELILLPNNKSIAALENEDRIGCILGAKNINLTRFDEIQIKKAFGLSYRKP